MAVRTEVTVETYTSGYTEFNRLIIRIHVSSIRFHKNGGKDRTPLF
jgi:hypothetical protein